MTWDLDDGTFAALAGFATRAPSMYNAQPWQFRYDPRGIDVLVDEHRLLPAGDPSGRAARLSCGAAAYTLQLALAVHGTPAQLLVRPVPSEPTLLARLVTMPPRPATPLERRLHAAVPRRHSNRHPFADEPVPVAARSELITAATAEGGWLALILGSTAIDATAALVRAADTLLNQNPAYRQELRAWTRDDPNAPDGVPAGAGGPAPRSDELLARRDFSGQERRGLRDYEREPLIGALGVPGEHPADEVRAGICLQRVLLTATDLGLATSMFSQPIDVPAIREELRLALGRPYAPMMLLRFGYAMRLAPSSRRPVHEVLEGTHHGPRRR